MNARLQGTNAYAQIGMETGVTAASPHKLITMLFEGALLSIATGKTQMQAGNIAEKGRSISHAIEIIDSGLKGGLDLDAGGELAQNLKDLYQYMVQQLLLANLHNKVEKLDEVTHLLTDIKSAWDAIDPAATPRQEAAAPAGKLVGIKA